MASSRGDTRTFILSEGFFFIFFYVLDLREGDKGGGLCSGW